MSGGISVRPEEYDGNWVRETWGWDTPESFVQSGGRNLRPRVLAALELACLKPGMRVLDVGCGRGEVVLHCARAAIHAVGVDYSSEVIALAERARAAHTPAEQAFMSFKCDDITRVDFPEKFDRIFMLDLVEHLHDWELRGLLERCRTLLAVDGAIIIHTLPNRWLYDVTYKYILRFFRPSLPEDPRSDKERAIHVNEMTVPRLQFLLEGCGFNCRVWLRDLIVEQARWHRRKELTDRRGRLYRLLANPMAGFCYKMLARTPLRPLIVNEIFAVAWLAGSPPPVKLPNPLTERLILSVCRRLRGRRC
jgi:SAM-dependent methyltransferase